MKRVFCVLCLVVIMLAGSINVFSAPYPEPGNDSASASYPVPGDETTSAPHPEPGNDSAAETVIVLSDIFEEQ